MRRTEIILIVLSIIVIGWAGFAPLFGAHDRQEAIRQECDLFYGPSGPVATAQCVAEMTDRSVTIRR